MKSLKTGVQYMDHDAIVHEALEKVEGIKSEAKALSLKIHQHPETGLQEHKACAWISESLTNHGFYVEQGLGSLETSFRAVRKGSRGPNIAFLAEYDALPKIGHGCGHNLVGTGSVYAAIVLSKMLPLLEGTITVLGTPAEEDKGGKITLLEEGFFQDVDFALMAHPASYSQIGRGGRAITSVFIEFLGKGAHSSNPANGINALNAVIQTFNGIDSQFQSFPRDINTNGIITSGGEADNIIPSYASCQFSVRGKTKRDVIIAVDRIKDIVRGVEAQTTAVAKIQVDSIYAERYPNMTMERRYGKYLQMLGEKVETADPNGRYGSSDIGNISLAMPAMHPYYKINDLIDPPMAHTKEWAEMAGSDRAHEGLYKNICALALLGRDILKDEDFRKRIQFEYKETVPGAVDAVV
jgi:amidohydrolase